MKKLVVLFFAIFLGLQVSAQDQLSSWNVTGHRITNGEWTVEVTETTIAIKDKDGKNIDVKSVYIRMESTDGHRLAIYHEVNLYHPEYDKRVKPVCDFFMNDDGIIRIKFKGTEIQLPTYKKLSSQN